jgi:UPF0755 protein
VSKKSFRFALATVVLTFVVLGGVGVWAARQVMHYPERKHHGSGQTVTLEITHGMKFPAIVGALANAHVIDRPSWFRIYAMRRGLANRVKAGKYVLRDDMSPHEVIDLLVQGVEEIEVSVTIPEGKNILEVFDLIQAAGIADAKALEKVARDPEWLRKQGIAGETVEGYLFPETYKFKQDADPRKVLEAMVRQHRVVYDELRKKHAASLSKIKSDLTWGDRQIVIMASIVEKETGDPTERPKVASVFYNRLEFSSFKSKKLETDPTIRYGCTIPIEKSDACKQWDPGGRLHEIQLKDDANPYNTYRHPNLPPGPISNPGRASIEAAMEPADTEYLYFVAKDERSHVFAKTLEEHKRNVDKYQK